MCTATNQSIVEEVIKGLVAKGEMFTAYDVTTLAKQQGAGEQHYQLKNAVHNLWHSGFFSSNDYTRTTIDVGQNIQPFLYHDYSDDTSSYTDRFKQAIEDRDGKAPDNSDDGIVQPDAVITATQSVIADPDPPRIRVPMPTIIVGGSNGTATIVSNGQKKTVKIKDGQIEVEPLKSEERSTDVDGRLNITRNLLKEIDLETEDEVIVDYKQSKSILRIWKADSGKGQYKVNADFRLRLGPKVLKSLGDSSSFVVDVYPTHMEISLP